MGCWNSTCAVSSLPILDGDPVRLLLLHQSLWLDIEDGPQRCMMGGTNARWTPRCIPIRGRYDHYGRVKDIDDDHWTVKLALARFRLDLVEREVGENSIHEQAIMLDEVLDGAPGVNGEPSTGIRHLQRLIQSDRVLIEVPNWPDEGSKQKRIAMCMIREDIYQLLATTITDDNGSGGHTPEATRKFVREQLLKHARRISTGDAEVDARLDQHREASMDRFIVPRMLGAGIALALETARLLGKHGDKYAVDASFGESIESTVRERYRQPASRFAEDYAYHLLTAGVGSDDPVIESIIDDVASFRHLNEHMNLLNRFWHPQAGQQDEGWISHLAIARKTIELAKEHIRDPDT